MKIITLTCLLFILPYIAFTQKNTGGVKGVIYDSVNDYALQAASVSVFKRADSGIVEFQLTNTMGEFEIKNLPVKINLYMVVTHAGYRTLVKNFLLDSLTTIQDFKRLNMLQKAENELEEVVIKVIQPVRMNGDTLEINPEAFKLDSGAVVEDMLMRVPGLTVWGDGTITMNGKPLDKVYVNGKPFFGGATQTATQNLPKNAIEKIQIYQQKDHSKLQQSDEKPDSLYTMNIKLKEDKNKGMFGKVGAGYGTQERYSGDGVMQFYNKRTQAGIATGINNINKEEGTGENAFIANTFKSNFMVFFGGRGGASGGITRRSYANLRVQHSFTNSDNSEFYNRITNDYGYLNTVQNANTHTTNVQNINNYKLSSISESNNINKNTSNNIKLLYENRKQYGSFVNITTNYTNSYSTDNNVTNTAVMRDETAISSSVNTSRSVTSANNLNFFGFIRSDNAGQLKDPRNNFMIHFSGSYNNNRTSSNTVSRFLSFIDTIPSDLIDRRYHTTGIGYNANVSFNYDGFRNLIFGIYNFFNIDMSLQNEVSINRNEMNAVVNDFDTLTGAYRQNELLTNKNIVTDFNYRPGLRLSKSFNKSVWEKYNYWVSFSAEIKHHFLNQQNESNFHFRNINRNFNAFNPSFNINFNYNRVRLFDISSYIWANSGLRPPTIDQLYPIVDSTNRYNIIAGNPNLKASVNRYIMWDFAINSAKPNVKNNYRAGFSANIGNTSNAFSENIVYDSSGRSIRYLINVDNQNSAGGNFNVRFSRKLNKLSTLSFDARTSFNSNIRPGFINSVKATFTNNSVSSNINATYSLTDKFNMVLGQTISNNRNQQKGGNNTSSLIRNYTTTTNINYFVTKKLTLNTSVNYQNNIAANGNSARVNIWNANVTYRFMQQKAEIRLSAFDLLRENQNIVNFVRENSATTTITNGLQQYYMVTFSFYPRKFGGNTSAPSAPRAVMIVK